MVENVSSLPYDQSLCEFSVTNIKVSVKLPKAVSLDFVVDRCLKLRNSTDLYCKRNTKNIATIRYHNFSYVLFKSCQKKLEDGSTKPNHCNITKCRTQEDILMAIQDLLHLVGQPPTFVDYTIDNYSCLANIPNSTIDIRKLYLNETDLQCTISEENFPCVTVRCPKHLSTLGNQICHIYAKGCFVLVGGKFLQDVEQYFQWLLLKAAPYVNHVKE